MPPRFCTSVHKYTAICAVAVAARICLASEIPTALAERIVDAIYVAEGGPRAKVPYGILSVPVKDAAEARMVCLNTVRNNWLRWEAAGRPGEYLIFLARRYCPPSVDPVGHRNWLTNVRRQLAAPKEAGKARVGGK